MIYIPSDNHKRLLFRFNISKRLFMSLLSSDSTGCSIQIPRVQLSQLPRHRHTLLPGPRRRQGAVQPTGSVSRRRASRGSRTSLRRQREAEALAGIGKRPWSRNHRDDV